jgi:hypothetical protein
MVFVIASCQQKEEKSTGEEASETMTTEAKAGRVIDVSEVTTVMTVKEIDLEDRLFTLEYAEGNVMVARAANDLTGIENIKIGDEVSVTYIKSTAVYVTSPDSARPAEVQRKEVQVDSKDGKPRKLMVDVYEKLSTVESLDRENRTATLKHADGTVEKVTVHKDFKGLDKVEVGDHVIYQFTQAIAVDIKKIEE